MNLQPINPAPAPGDMVQCSSCDRMSLAAFAVADLDAKAPTYYCDSCRDDVETTRCST